jgi:hypothetical protein
MHYFKGLGLSLRSVFWDITPCCPLKIAAFPQEHVASTFGVDEEANQETSMKQVENRAYHTLQHEDGGDVSWLPTDYTALCPGRQLFITTCVRTSNSSI